MKNTRGHEATQPSRRWEVVSVSPTPRPREMAKPPRFERCDTCIWRRGSVCSVNGSTVVDGEWVESACCNHASFEVARRYVQHLEESLAYWRKAVEDADDEA